jgi:hypothetical protein
MAESMIIRTLSRRTSADSGEACVITKAFNTSPLVNASRMLLLKVVGLLVFCASDGDFMVVVVVVVVVVVL